MEGRNPSCLLRILRNRFITRETSPSSRIRNLQVVTSRGRSDITETAVKELKGNIRGELLTSDSPGYDKGRVIWNAMIDKRPAIIVRCAGAADVIHAVDFARKNDLLVSVRGGGGNFGVITSFEFQLHPVGPAVFSGLIVFPFDQAKTVLKKYREFVENIPDDLSVWVVLRKAPPLPFLPAEVHGKEIVVFAIFYAGDPAKGEKLIAPIRNFAKILGEHVGSQPYVMWQRAFDPLLTPGFRNYWKSHNFSTLTDPALDTMVEYASKLPTPHCEIFIGLIGGQASRVTADQTPYSQTAAKFVFNVHGRWETPNEDQKCT